MKNSDLDNAELSNVISQIVTRLKSTTLQTQLKYAAKKEAEQQGVTKATLRNDIAQGLKSSGWEKVLRNAVYRELNRIQGEECSNSKLKLTSQDLESRKEPLEYLRKAQANWERRILKSMNSMCTELSIPLARKRPNDEQRDLLQKWNEMGTDEPDLSHFRPVYAPKDFLEVIASLQNSNFNATSLAKDSSTPEQSKSMNTLSGLIQIPLEVSSIAKLGKKYSELNPKISQNGVDDCTEVLTQLFSADRQKVAKKVLDDKQSSVAQYFLRQGSPNGSRADIWQLALGVTVDHLSILHYEQLKGYVLQHDLLVDSLIYKDVKLTATNDDYYFVFEDYLYQVLLVFSRDTFVLRHFTNSSATPPKSFIKGKWGQDEYAVIYPPNGVIPFHGFSMYVTPLCYLYAEPTRLYYMFRELYMRYFYHLHTISSHPQGIVSLCLLFETTLQAVHPKLFHHLQDIGIQPLKIAFKWLVRAYSGYLATYQLHLLWDRIIGFGDLRLLSIFAVAIFVFRQANLLSITSPGVVEAAMADISTLHVVPLLQMILFPD
ncbi:TBC1 domain family member 19-like [Styela clava]